MIDPRLAASSVTLPRATPKDVMVPNLNNKPDFKALLEVQPLHKSSKVQTVTETRSERISRFEKPRVGVPIAPFAASASALTLAETSRPWLVTPAGGGAGTAPRGPTLADAIDIINPLQHIPLVGQLYRGITGDEISGPARFIGGTIYGGPLGGALAMADVALKDKTGRSFSEAVVARIEGAPEMTQVASGTQQVDDRAFSLMVSGLVTGDQDSDPYIS